MHSLAAAANARRRSWPQKETTMAKHPRKPKPKKTTTFTTTPQHDRFSNHGLTRVGKAAGRTAKATDTKAKHTSAIRELKPLVKKINTHFALAKKNDAKADDNRLAAALHLDDAKQRCEADGLNFKKWAMENIEDQAWETVRKLVAVGGAANPALALADMRAGNKTDAKKSRQKAKAKARGHAATVETLRQTTPLERIDQAFEAISDKATLEIIKSRAKKEGMAEVSATDAKIIKSKQNGDGLMMAKNAFDALGASDKRKLAEYAAGMLGMVLATPADADHRFETDPKVKVGGDDPGPVPDFLQRGKKKSRGRKAA